MPNGTYGGVRERDKPALLDSEYLFAALKVIKFLHKGIDIVEIPVYGRETHVGDLVDVPYFFSSAISPI